LSSTVNSLASFSKLLTVKILRSKPHQVGFCAYHLPVAERGYLGRFKSFVLSLQLASGTTANLDIIVNGCFQVETWNLNSNDLTSFYYYYYSFLYAFFSLLILNSFSTYYCNKPNPVYLYTPSVGAVNTSAVSPGQISCNWISPLPNGKKEKKKKKKKKKRKRRKGSFQPKTILCLYLCVYVSAALE